MNCRVRSELLEGFSTVTTYSALGKQAALVVDSPRIQLEFTHRFQGTVAVINADNQVIR